MEKFISPPHMITVVWSIIPEDIFTSAQKRVRIHERYMARGIEEQRRRNRRTASDLPDYSIVSPPEWDWNPDFNPYVVRRRASQIAHAISPKIMSGAYETRPPALHRVAKKDGSYRDASCFSIPDEAVSRKLYRSLISKNTALFSGNSFAYRPNLVSFDAIQHIRSRWNQENRIYVGEFDFRRYFDNISHPYLLDLFNTLGVYRTTQEDHLIRQFLQSRLPTDPLSQNPGAIRKKGIPQGTTISLFLANVALTPVDREFDRIGVNFVRYADDTLIWSRNYQDAVDALAVLHDWSRESCVKINFEKSEGIRILRVSDLERTEFRSTRSVHFLGHDLLLDR